MRPKKLIIIVGPTATGKTNLAIKLAKMFKGEIVSADSRAVYRGLPIGTSSPISKNKKKASKRKAIIIDGRQLLSPVIYKGVRHHMIGFRDPKKVFSAYDFSLKATRIIKNIKTPIIAGGAGFWIDTLLNADLLEKIPANPRLRKKLESWSIADLFAELKKLNSTRAETIEKKNKRRLIRAVEIARYKHRAGAKSSRQARTINFDTFFLGTDFPNKILKKRIEKRFQKMLRQGLVAETKKLTQAVSKIRLKEIGLAYPIVADYIAGKITRDEMIEKSVNATYHYAKRQKTWFKKNKKIHWVKNESDAIKLANKFLHI